MHSGCKDGRGSKALVVFLEVSTDGASQHLLLSIPRVITSHRTCPRTRTLGQLLLGVLAHVITITLFLMTRLTEMGVSPAEPLSNTTTKLTLEFDEIFAMLGAILNWYFAAIRTNEFLWVKRAPCVLRLVHSSNAVLPTTEVRIFTLETHEVGVDDICVLLWLAEIRRALFFKFLIRLLQFFKFESIERHGLNLLMKSLEFL